MMLDSVYVGKTVTTASGRESGIVVGVRGCPLESCSGPRLVVKWPNGKKSHPCTHGMDVDDAGNWRIRG